MQKLRGTGVAIVTPFRNDDSIDFDALGKIINHIIAGGADYIVAMGTTSETPTLSNVEKNAIASYVKEVVDGRVPIVLGIGSNNTSQVIETIKNTDLEGIDAILSVTPYYNKPIQKGLFIHYKTIATASPIPIILYNVPSRTGVNLTAETILQLAEDFPNIIGVKEASGSIEQVMNIIKNRPKDFLVISGDDTLVMPSIAAGADGCISVTASAFPKEYSEMVKASLKGSMKSARELHYKLLDFSEAIFSEGSPGGIKAALSILGLCTKYVRLPLASVSRTTLTKIEKSMEGLR